MRKSKVDLKKKLKQFYNPKPIPEVLEVPTMQFLIIDRKGRTENQEFQDPMEALFK